MAQDPQSAADNLVRSADAAGETVARSAYDSAFSDFELPEDPSDFGKLYGGASRDLSSDLDLGGALQKSNKLTLDKGMADAAAVFENRYKQEEVSKTPLSELDQEIDRLSTQRWGVLPSMLARTDILDYGAKLRMATRAEQIMDGEIDRLVSTRKNINSAAEARAKTKVEELQASAKILDSQATAAKNDLANRIDLFKEGNATFDDVVQSALELRRLNDAKNKGGGGSGNPFFGMSDTEFAPAEISAFGVYETTGEWPASASVNNQMVLQLTDRYRAWKQAGRPGSKVRVQTGTTPYSPLPEGVSGPQMPGSGLPTFEEKDITDLFQGPADAKKNGQAEAVLKAFGLK